MIQGDDFGDHGDVLARVGIDGDLRQLDIEYGGGLDVEPGTLDDRVLVPFLELNHYLDALLLPDGPDAKYSGNVDQYDATDLHVVALHLVPACDQHIVAAHAGDDQIVRDEAVAPLDEIQHALRLADTALAGEEQPNAEDVSERAVQDHRRRELHLEHRLDPPVELRGLEL